MKVNLKAATGVLQLITGVLSFTIFLILFIYGIYPQELTVLYFQMTCGALGLLNILLGLESIFLRSNDKRIIRNELTFGAISSLLLVVLLIVTSHDFAAVYLGDSIMDSDIELWQDFVVLLYKTCYFISSFNALLLCVIFGLSSFLLYKNHKEQ